MPVRSTMSDIILRVRLLINDQGAPPVFTDQNIQDTLDERRTDLRYQALTPVETIAGPPNAGTVTWLDYYAEDGWWEEDAQLVSNVFAPLTPATSEWIVGHWTFSANQLPPVYIVGKTFDLYAAAADTLEQWIALLKLQYTTQQEGDQFKRIERITNMQGLADQYRTKQKATSATLIRTDTHPGSDVNFYLRPFNTRGA